MKCLKLLFFLFVLYVLSSCRYNDSSMEPILNSCCMIEYSKNSIIINVDTSKYVFTLREGNYYFANGKDSLAMSISSLGRVHIGNYTSDIDKVSDDQFVSSLCVNGKVLIINYDSKYKITKFSIGGYIQFGEEVKEPPIRIIQLDSQISSQIKVVEIE